MIQNAYLNEEGCELTQPSFHVVQQFTREWSNADAKQPDQAEQANLERVVPVWGVT